MAEPTTRIGIARHKRRCGVPGFGGWFTTCEPEPPPPAKFNRHSWLVRTDALALGWCIRLLVTTTNQKSPPGRVDA